MAIFRVAIGCKQIARPVESHPIYLNSGSEGGTLSIGCEFQKTSLSRKKHITVCIDGERISPKFSNVRGENRFRSVRRELENGFGSAGINVAGRVHGDAAG